MPAVAVQAVEAGHVLLESAETERQLLALISRPYFVSLIGDDVRASLTHLMSVAEPIGIPERITSCRDPTDDKFLDLAVSGNADLIVSGDADLLALNPFRGIPIVTPALFVQSATR